MKYAWIIAGVAAACVGLFLGGSLRSRHDSDDGLTTRSGLYASNQQPGDETMFGGIASDDYFDTAREILVDDFVDPITDETKLTRGALQTMLQELDDPSARYYAPNEWDAYIGMFEGKYSGIGADLAVRKEAGANGERLPVRVVSVAPGGPADKAGLKTGDWIDEIDGRWVASYSLLAEVQAASAKLTKKQITRKQFDAFVDTLQKRSDRMIPIFPALEELQSKTGPIKLKVNRGDKSLTFAFTRKPYEVEPVQADGNTIRIHSFSKDSAVKLADLIDGKSSLVLDVRGNPGGSFKAMVACLAELAPKGVYGMQQKNPDEPPMALALTQGADKPPRLTVLVDKGTAREAELFVAALRDLAGAEIEGGPTWGDGRRIDRFALPDGSGYTLTSAHFYDSNGRPLVRGDKSATEQAKQPQGAKL